MFANFRWNLHMYLRMLSFQLRSQMQFRFSFWMDIVSTGFGNLVVFPVGCPDHPALWQHRRLEPGGNRLPVWHGGNVLRGDGYDLQRLRLRTTLPRVVREGKFRPGDAAPGRADLAGAGLAFSAAPGGAHPGRADDFYRRAVAGPMCTGRWERCFTCRWCLPARCWRWARCLWSARRSPSGRLQSIEAVNILTYGGTELMSYPMQIYPCWMQRFFTFVIPFIFLNFYPALYFLDKPDPLHFPAFAPFHGAFCRAVLSLQWRWRSGGWGLIIIKVRDVTMQSIIRSARIYANRSRW